LLRRAADHAPSAIATVPCDGPHVGTEAKGLLLSPPDHRPVDG